MQYAVILLGALVALPAANCVAFGGPAPTNTSPDRALNGFTPIPTKGPSVAELRRRQGAAEETCGWVDESFSSAITCRAGRSCVLYTTASAGVTAGMAGCCADGDTQDCGWAYSCVDYSSYSAGFCDSTCESDDFVRKCTDASAPFCTTWMYASDSVFDYGCGADGLDTLQMIYQTGVNGALTTSITLETISDDAVSFSDVSSDFNDLSSDFTDIFTSHTKTTTTTSSDSEQTDPPSAGGAANNKTKTGKKKVSISLIIGAVVGGLVLIGIIAAVIIFLCVKQKKKKQLAANQAAMANAQALRPQSSMNPAAQPQMQQAPPPPPPVPQQPNPAVAGYFNQQQAYGNDQKINPQTNVHEFNAQTPNSNPATPAPPYVQPYYAATPVVPPIPTASPAPYPPREPTPGAHEVDAISVAHPPNSQPGHVVYELGGGK